MWWNHKFRGCNFRIQIFIILAPERKTTTEKCEEQHTRCIYVSWWATELFFLYDLWSHIGWGAAEKFDLLCVGNLCAKTEINQFDISLVVKHHIFQLYVTMRHALVVQVTQGADQLRVDSFSLVFMHLPVWPCLEKAMCGPSTNVFKHKHNLSVRFNRVIELRNIWMAEAFHQLDFPPDRFLTCEVFHLFLYVNLKCHFFV
jgi:hypothetical protein